MNMSTNHQLDFRFFGESETHHFQGTQQEIEDLIEDFNWTKLNSLFKSPYCKKHGIKAIKPDAAIVHHIIWPIQPDKPIVEIQKELKVQTAPIHKALKQSFDLLRHKRNREHEACFIHLFSQTTVTCSETGISFSVELPIPEKLNLEILHPLSFFSNVQEVIRTYGKQGIHLESELSNQILAGMLLTIWKHKKLLVCHDYVQANICLQRANAKTLSYAVRFFASLPSSIGLPQLHLIPEALYDFHHAPTTLTKEQIIADRIELMVQNFIKVCKGESDSETKLAGQLLRTKKEKATIRISGGNAAIEARQAQARKKLGFQLLEQLKQQFPVPQVSQIFYESLASKLDAFLFLGTEKRAQASKEILDMFGESKQGRELANLFSQTKTETIELGLDTFSHEIEKDLQEWKGQKRKFNLLALSVTQQKKESE